MFRCEATSLLDCGKEAWVASDVTRTKLGKKRLRFVALSPNKFLKDAIADRPTWLQSTIDDPLPYKINHAL